ncbi:MAG: hypothetical protein DRO06_00640, partial [Thermoproteota archaeon]
VKVMTLRGGGWAVAYLSVDGNNMDPEFREELADAIRGRGYIPVVATTDTHATLSPRRPVNPVGQAVEEREAILRSAMEALDAAERSEEEVEFSAGVREVEVEFMDPDAWISLLKAGEVAGAAIPLVALGAALPAAALALAALL